MAGAAGAETKSVTMSAPDTVRMAGKMIERGEFDGATRILTTMPPTDNLSVEIERWFLLGQISQRRGDVDSAIKIYRKILDGQPDLSRVRYALAQCYMVREQWYRADYHLRRAMAGDDIPDDVKQRMQYYRYLVRKNKNWNLWFNFGAAPDNNINQVAGGEECVTNAFGTFCRQLPDPVSAVGYNLTLGGDYEFKLSEHWRWKNDANIYINVYDKHDFDDLYLAVSTGPRYVWQNGDVWLAAMGARRFYGWDGYNTSYGLRLDTNYDFTRRLSGGISWRMMDNIYDDYGDMLDGQTYSISGRVMYSIDTTKYIVLRGGPVRETASMDMYANWRHIAAIGFGAELPWGFHVYIEPSYTWVKYDGPRWVVSENHIKHITEHDDIWRYAVALSNNKLDVWGFVPTITFSYAYRDSNIYNRKYNKTTIEFSMRQRF